jgi:PAS domain S-box-containing protein
MKFQLDIALLKTILEDTHAFMGVYDIESSEFLFINSAGLEMLEIVDIDDFKTKYPEGIRKYKLSPQEGLKVFEFLQKETIWNGEVLFRKFSGKEFWGLMQVSLFYQNNRKLYFIRINDIGARKVNEQKIRDEQLKFEALFMHAAIGIIMVNRESKIVLSNHFADVLFGYEPGELMGRQLDILIPKNVRETHRKTYENYTHKPQSRVMGMGLDLKGKRKDGSLFPVEISLSHFKSGEIPYYISFINDVTLKKNAEKDLINQKSEIEKMNQNLEKEVINRTNTLVETLKNLEYSKKELEVALNKEKELGDLKSRFVSMASHEFRTPLTTIQSSASLIEKYLLTEDQDKRQRHIQKIKNSVGNLTDILEEFLSVGKLEEGRIEANMTTFNVQELVEDSISDLKSMLKNGQIINYEHKGFHKLFLDKSLLRKILINLCSNALKFSPENSVISLAIDNQEDTFFFKCFGYWNWHFKRRPKSSF